MDLTALSPLIIAIIAALPGLFALAIQRRKHEADAASTLTDSVLKLLAAKDAESDELRAELKAAHDEAVMLDKRLTKCLEEKLQLQAHVKVCDDNAAELSRTLSTVQAELDERRRA